MILLELFLILKKALQTVFRFALCAALLIALVICWGGERTYSESDARHEVASSLQISPLPTCTVPTALDNHGGFLGDGETLIRMQFSDDSFWEAIQDRATWGALSDRADVGAVVDWLQYGWEYSRAFYASVSKVENGYCYFKDRQTDAASEDAYSAEPTLDRYSYNFTLAVYDVETRVLYYYKLDT